MSVESSRFVEHGHSVKAECRHFNSPSLAMTFDVADQITDASARGEEQREPSRKLAPLDFFADHVAFVLDVVLGHLIPLHGLALAPPPRPPANDRGTQYPLAQEKVDGRTLDLNTEKLPVT